MLYQVGRYGLKCCEASVGADSWHDALVVCLVTQVADAHTLRCAVKAIANEYVSHAVRVADDEIRSVRLKYDEAAVTADPRDADPEALTVRLVSCAAHIHPFRDA